MSDELDWELYDIFEAGLFPFPLYEHQTARKIIRYLLYRGVADEEIADAIEDSTADLHIWLNRAGKNMVGEWVIAWMNDVRDEYRREKQREARERGDSWHDYEMGSEASYSGDDGDDPPVPGQGHTHRQSDAEMRDWAERMRAIDDSNAESSIDGENEEEEEAYDEQTLVKKPPTPSPSPPPLPPRSSDDYNHINNTSTTNNDTTNNLTSRVPLQYLTMHCSIDSQTQTPSSDISPRSHVTLDDNQQTPDSGAVSDIYSSIPPGGSDHRTVESSSEDNLDPEVGTSTCPPGSNFRTFQNFSTTQERCDDVDYRDQCYYTRHLNDIPQGLLDNHVMPACTQESHINIANSGCPSCPNCQCSLVHYSIIPARNTTAAQTTTTYSDNIAGIMKNGQLKTSDSAQLNLYINEESSRAMDLHIDTLDRDGPGYIFVMTDATQNFLPWSHEHRYKIASSRQPERWLNEFKSRKIDVDLIWQVKVRHHLIALRDIHRSLQKFNLHSNWFKCSLSKIMDVISRTVRKYRF